jgi:hypothetical protein
MKEPHEDTPGDTPRGHPGGNPEGFPGMSSRESSRAALKSEDTLPHFIFIENFIHWEQPIKIFSAILYLLQKSQQDHIRNSWRKIAVDNVLPLLGDNKIEQQFASRMTKITCSDR